MGNVPFTFKSRKLYRKEKQRSMWHSFRTRQPRQQIPDYQLRTCMKNEDIKSISYLSQEEKGPGKLV